MKLTTDRDALLDALASAGRAATAGSAFGVAGLSLSLDGDILTATGADPDLVITATTTVNGQDNGSVVVPPRLIVDVVRSFKDGVVDLVSEDENLRVTSGAAEFTVRTIATDVVALKPVPDTPDTIFGPLLAEGLRQVVRAALKDNSRSPQLTGVRIESTVRGVARLTATDSYRLAICDLTGVSLTDHPGPVIVPSRALAEVQRLVTDDQDILFTCDDLHATFTVGNVTLTTRLIRGDYPDVDRLIPASYPCSFTCDRETLTNAVKRVRTMITASKGITTPVRLAFVPGGVDLTVETPETGRAFDRVDGVYVGDPGTIAFNPSFFLDGLDAVTGDKVSISYDDGGKPACLNGEDAGYRYLLMPVRVN
jgi:DNA polymerase-3 subunit beta